MPPERTCVGCGKKRRKEGLLRLSRGLTGLEVHLDGGGGRGVYLCPCRDCLEQALKRRTLQRALGEGLGPLNAERLKVAVRQTVLLKVKRLLGLARRARRVMAGHEAVAKTLEAGRIRLLLLSQDISPGEGERFIREGDRRAVPVVILGLSREEFGEALGGPPRVVAGITDSGFAEGIAKTVAYLIPER